ncbi:hypothetical protein [Nocardiopsis potens]|uniref:hypothetical protein n=1 Tax=Nocardiopsis potens TaxID=1246458 RepID=UPI00034D05E8|nr:hypothetical protein [Nocardiopsis potens]
MCIRPTALGLHHVCLDCRVAFKHAGRRDRTCPNCAGGLIDAGNDLEVPRRGDEAGWRVLGVLLRAGVTFHSSCCGGPGWRPRTMGQVKERLAAAERTGTPIAEALTTADTDEIGRRPHPARRPVGAAPR